MPIVCIKKNYDEINGCTVSQQKAKCFSLHAHIKAFAIWSSCMLHIVCVVWTRARARAFVCAFLTDIQTKREYQMFYSRIYALIFRLTSFKSSRLSIDSMHGLRWQWWIFECIKFYITHIQKPYPCRYIVQCNYQTKHPTIKFIAL